jgi:hypothetical protein
MEMSQCLCINSIYGLILASYQFGKMEITENERGSFGRIVFRIFDIVEH